MFRQLQSVGHASDRYLRELGRRNYVTPTSYLSLIATFKSLLKGKRDEILSLKARYEMGLGKLEFASSQVRKYTRSMLYMLQIARASTVVA